MTQEIAARFPRKVNAGDTSFEVRLMTPADETAVLELARGLPRHDLLFLRRDITNAKVTAAWAQSLVDGDITSLLALTGDKVVGCSAVVTDPLGFSPHVGELRVLLAADARTHGLGRQLIQESFLVALSLGLEKLTTRMTPDQEAAITVFEDMGFRAEALLRDHVRGDDGRTHDLLLLAHDVAAVQAKMALYGIDEAAAAD